MIPYRGKSTVDGKWEYGLPVNIGDRWFIAKKPKQIIKNNNNELGISFDEIVPVLESTVSEYTGVVDTEDNKLFSGDIVEVFVFDKSGNKDSNKCLRYLQTKEHMALKI